MLKVEVIPVIVPLDEFRDRESMLNVVWVVFDFIVKFPVPALVSDFVYTFERSWMWRCQSLDRSERLLEGERGGFGVDEQALQ